jgi:hypothetical protein
MHYVSTLREIVARGKQRRPELAGRIERAAMIALFRAIGRQEDGTFLVESDSRPGQFYRVNGTCDCPDHAKAPDGWCKHRLAIGLLRVCAEREHARRWADDRAALALAGALR